jgi:uncharacterized protein YggT (Ycf19 family)
MTEDQKLAIDEADRAYRYRAVKAEARQDVQEKIANRAKQDESALDAESAAISERMKDKTVKELAGTESEIERGRTAARISQVADYVFGAIYALIALEILLELLAARENNSFKNFVDTLTAPLLLPFKNLVTEPSIGQSQLKLSYFIALVVYIMLHLAVNGLLRMLAHRKTAI